MHVIVLRKNYNFMSNFTIDMTRIPHRCLYYNLSTNNFKNCKNIFFVYFDSTSFNIVIFLMTACIIHSCFLCNYLRFLDSIVLLLCDTNKLFIVSSSKIPSSKTKTASLCCCKVFFFMHVVVTC